MCDIGIHYTYRYVMPFVKRIEPVFGVEKCRKEILRENTRKTYKENVVAYAEKRDYILTFIRYTLRNSE